MNATTSQVTTFLRLTATSTGARAARLRRTRSRQVQGPPAWGGRLRPMGNTLLTRHIGGAPIMKESAGFRSGPRQEVLAGRPERQVGIDAVAQVDQLQLLGQEPGGVHRPHDQPEPDA